MRAGDRARGVFGGLAAGLAGGLFGVGGGVILVPLLTSRFRLTQHQAHGTSLAVIGITALAGLIVYGAFAQVAWRTAALVALASALTARYGARWAARTPSAWLSRAFAVFLVLVAARLMVKVPEVTSSTFEGLAAVGFDLALGAAVGLLAGYMGVGGGILAVPTFTLVLGMSQQTAQGTSLAVMLVSGPAGAWEHARHRNLVGPLVLPLGVGAVMGAPLSSWVAQLLPHEVLVRSFALFLVANAAYTWVGAGSGSRSAAG